MVEAIIVELSETAASSLGVETVFNGTDKDSVPIGVTVLVAQTRSLAIIGSSADETDVVINYGVCIIT